LATDGLPIHSFIKADYRFVAPPCQLEGRPEKPGFQRLTTYQDDLDKAGDRTPMHYLASWTSSPSFLP
jgi:hypothetical protein